MHDFSSSLLREKFVIHNVKPSPSDSASTVALSNRLVVETRNTQNEIVETLVVRTQNMHSAVRMAAKIIHDTHSAGPLVNRQIPYDWEKTWDTIVNSYEQHYNPQRWIAIYAHGKCIFKAGEHHPFLDMIEKCDDSNTLDYDYAVPMAEKLFQQAGQDVRINHNTNVALSVHFEKNIGRLGIILRGSNKTTTFSFSIRPKKKECPLNVPQSLGAAAAFLEGVQLAFLTGMNMEKIRLDLIKRSSKEEQQTKAGRKRLTRLSVEISNLEDLFDVRYRPEKPNFQALLAEAEELGHRILEPPEPKSEDDSEDSAE